MIGWIANLVIILGLILLGRKNRAGWLCSIIGNILWCFYAIEIQLWSGLFIDALTLCIATYNWRVWNKYD